MTHLRRTLLITVVSALLACAGASAAPVARVGHAGRWLTDPGGRVVVTHGFNMVYKLAPYDPAAAGFGADDAAFLARLGFNVVRVGVIWKAVEPHPGVYDNRYLAQIERTVRLLARDGIYSLLDFHQDMYNEAFQGEGAPDWAVQTDGLPGTHNGFPANYLTSPALQRAEDHFWSNSPGPGGVGLQDRYAAAWRHVAQRFRTVPGVLGYELFNEPSAGTLFASCLSATGCAAFESQLTGFDDRVAHAIRTADRRTMIFYEPQVSFNFGVDTQVGPLRAGATGFAFHDYCLPVSASGCASETQPFVNALHRSATTRDALLLDEFGADPYPGDLARMTGLADSYMIPWIEWAYCGCGDPTTTGSGDQQAFVRNPGLPPSGANLRRPTYPLLVEPFPHLIAGTPLSWSFDRQTSVFTLVYSTARAAGHGRFGAGAVTAVATPGVIYARPYAVHVQGGAILSPRGARTLRIAACRGARRITVTVLPRGRNRASCQR